MDNNRAVLVAIVAIAMMGMVTLGLAVLDKNPEQLNGLLVVAVLSIGGASALKWLERIL